MPLPPLPPILPDLKRDVFTHKGLHGLPSSLRVDEPGAPANWERLAFLGDAVLQICATNWLFSSYPTSRIGDLTMKRVQIVANKTLASWSRAYELPQRILAHPSTEFQLRNMPSDKIRGSLFEAYLAAVYLTGPDGPMNAQQWIDGILNFEYEEGQLRLQNRHRLNSSVNNSDIVALQLRAQALKLIDQSPKTISHSQALVSARNTKPTPDRHVVQEPPKGYINYLSAFNERAAQRGIYPMWDSCFTGPDHRRTWKAIVTVSGHEFQGSGSTIKEARNLAAKVAWNSLNWQDQITLAMVP